ncbi:MAG TPA: GspMb/PilO family protein [Candidatus Acidoferrales bacterium]|nr:GspMb/PilO family protein [Candidatus Acidoferrales bacterium]
MNETLESRKNLVRWIISVVLALDLILLVVNLRHTSSGLEQKLEEAVLEKQHDLLAADVRRAMEIRMRLPAVQGECDDFFRTELRPAATGYSAVVSDLGALAKQAGLRTDTVTFRQHDLSSRNVVEVEVVASIQGDYPSLVSFINGLERSKNFYLLDGLQLASSTGSNLKLNLQLRTYFRS